MTPDLSITYAQLTWTIVLAFLAGVMAVFSFATYAFRNELDVIAAKRMEKELAALRAEIKKLSGVQS